MDEFGLIISPLVLGSGKRLFRNGSQARNLRLICSTTTPKGNVLASYSPA